MFTSSFSLSFQSLQRQHMLGGSDIRRQRHERSIEQYARQLKVPLESFPEIRPILEEGIARPLPDGWTAVLNDSNQLLYFHSGSGACRPDHPMDEMYRNKCLEVIANLKQLRREEVVRQQSSHLRDIQADFDRVIGLGTDSFGDREESTSSENWLLLSLPEPGSSKDARSEKSSRSPADPVTPIVTETHVPRSVVASHIASRMQSADRESLLNLQSEVATLREVNKLMSSQLNEVLPLLHQAQKEREAYPEEFYCPITGDVMRDPVVTLDGFTYERTAIQMWLSRHDTSPCTNQVLPSKTLISNLALRSQIQNRLGRSS
jgi:hypothetical protein